VRADNDARRWIDVKQIGVFLAGMPPLLHDIVRDTIANQTDMQLVGDLSVGDSVVDTLKNREIDVAIVGAREPDDATRTDELFLSSPRSKVLVIATSGRSAVMYQLRPHKRPLGDVSPQSLLDAIRQDL
jgi:DNA-binding NarL/FixJ family response regulator